MGRPRESVTEAINQEQIALYMDVYRPAAGCRCLGNPYRRNCQSQEALYRYALHTDFHGA
jgi:hypothetical protein